MFADILQMPIEVIDVDELGALGCAMLASIAAGIYNGYQEAARSMVKVKYRVEPDSSRKEVYERKYKTYKKAVATLNELWLDLV